MDQNIYGEHGELTESRELNGTVRNFDYDLSQFSTATGKMENHQSGETTAERIQLFFDSAGNTTHEFPINKGVNAGSYRTYDGLGRIKTEVQNIDSNPANGGVASLRAVNREWNYPLVTGSEKVVYTDRNQNVHTAEFTPGVQQQVDSIVSGSGATISGGYSKTTQFNPDGSVQFVKDTSDYNAPGLPNSMQHISSESRIEMLYDSLGRAEQTVSAAGFLGTAKPAIKTVRSFGLASQVTSKTHSVGLSIRTGTEVTAGTLTPTLVETYGYDELNRLRTLTQDFAPGTSVLRRVRNKEVEYKYDHLGNRTFVDRKTSVNGSISSTANTVVGTTIDGRVDLITHRLESNGKISEFDPEYNSGIRIKTRTSNYYTGTDNVTPAHTDQVEYKYAEGRLNEVIRPSGTHILGWTQFGNLSDNQQQFGLENRILSDANSKYRFDNEGNLTGEYTLSNSPKIEYFYDPLNRLTAVRSYFSQVTRTLVFGYDVTGRRFALHDQIDTGSSSSSSSRSWLYDGESQLMLANDLGQINQYFMHDPQSSELLAVDSTIIANQTKTHWAFGSGGGTVASWYSLDDNTTKVSHVVYDEYGNVSDVFAPLSPLRVPDELPSIWSGLMRDTAAPLYESDGRWYRSSLSGYLTQDSSDSINPYRFDGGDPISRSAKTRLINAATIPEDPLKGVYGTGLVGVYNRVGSGFWRSLYSDEYLTSVEGFWGGTKLWASTTAGLVAAYYTGGATFAAVRTGGGLLTASVASGAVGGSTQYLVSHGTATAMDTLSGHSVSSGFSVRGLVEYTGYSALFGGLLVNPVTVAAARAVGQHLLKPALQATRIQATRIQATRIWAGAGASRHSLGGAQGHINWNGTVDELFDAVNSAVHTRYSARAIRRITKEMVEIVPNLKRVRSALCA